jgi:hypothetical protein
MICGEVADGGGKDSRDGSNQGGVVDDIENCEQRIVSE